MKDKERSFDSDLSRVILLGDSFVEGYGLSNSDTIGSNLEEISDKSYLNFGTSGHFGSTQYYLMYKNKASKFSHEDVYIFITPLNDLDDDSYEYGLKNHNQRYRPYHVKNEDAYKLLYYNEDFFNKEFRRGFQTIFSSYSSSYHVLKQVYILISSWGDKNRLHGDQNIISGYFDFNKDQVDLLVNNLNLIKSEAFKHNASVKIFLIPGLGDYEAAKYRSILGKETELFKELKTRLPNDFLFDFFGPLYKAEDNFENLFLLCDGHLNDYGAGLVSEMIISNVRKL